jgi:hypothetical protein
MYLQKSVLEGMKIKQCCVYRVSQEEKSIFWEAIVSVILSKRNYMYTWICVLFWMDVITRMKEHQDALKLCLHMRCKVHWSRQNFRKCIILGKLYQLCHLNNKLETVCSISFFWTILELYSEIALSWKPFRIGHMYIQGVPGGMCQTSGGCSLC